ncbi:IS3 family transposase [Amycolatopsis sp. VS8301801F10]|uniref:IS3 family transposase n=1 Tax=Amycolatopsis sp. VS8301801F10 TaxID=2652442 RepID=UPI0038FC5D47
MSAEPRAAERARPGAGGQLLEPLLLDAVGQRQVLRSGGRAGTATLSVEVLRYSWNVSNALDSPVSHSPLRATSRFFGPLTTASPGRPDICWINSVLFRRQRRQRQSTEVIAGGVVRETSTGSTAHKAISEYIEGWYNTRRPRSSISYLSPASYETTTFHVA